MLKIRLNILQQQAKKNRQASQQERVPQSRASNLRILSEKYLQNQQDPYYHVFFIDLKKAFDRVWHAALWSVMKKYNISTTLIRVMKNV